MRPQVAPLRRLHRGCPNWNSQVPTASANVPASAVTDQMLRAERKRSNRNGTRRNKQSRTTGHRTRGLATSGRKECDEAEETRRQAGRNAVGGTPRRVRHHEAGTSEEKRVGAKKKQRRNAETGQLVVRDHSSLDGPRGISLQCSGNGVGKGETDGGCTAIRDG